MTPPVTGGRKEKAIYAFAKERTAETNPVLLRAFLRAMKHKDDVLMELLAKAMVNNAVMAELMVYLDTGQLQDAEDRIMLEQGDRMRIST